MTNDQIRLHFGELSASEMRLAAPSWAGMRPSRPSSAPPLTGWRRLWPNSFNATSHTMKPLAGSWVLPLDGKTFIWTGHA